MCRRGVACGIHLGFLLREHDEIVRSDVAPTQFLNIAVTQACVNGEQERAAACVLYPLNIFHFGDFLRGEIGHGIVRTLDIREISQAFWID